MFTWKDIPKEAIFVYDFTFYTWTFISKMTIGLYPASVYHNFYKKLKSNPLSEILLSLYKTNICSNQKLLSVAWVLVARRRKISSLKSTYKSLLTLGSIITVSHKIIKNRKKDK